MKICGVYGIFCAINSKVLVGSTSNMYHRWWVHRNDANNAKHKNPHFQSAWTKYGESSFEFRILEECPSVNLVAREDYWMAFYKSLDKQFGYNMQNATHSFRSQETCAKISLANKGRPSRNKGKPMSGETKKRISMAKTGKPMTEQAKASMRIARLKAGPLSAEARKAISDAHKGNKYNLGRKPSEETRRKMSMAHSGSKNHFYGKRHPDDLIKRIALAHKGSKRTPEANAKCRESMKAWWAEHPEQKQAAAQRMKQYNEKHPVVRLIGSLNPFFGRKHTPETILKLSENAKKRHQEKRELSNASPQPLQLVATA